MSNDGRERGTIRLTVPEMPKREATSWVGKWPTCDLVENDRIMVGYNQGSTIKARVRNTWRSEQKGTNYGRTVVSFTYADNDDPVTDGQFGTEWADEVYPLGAQVFVGYGSDERGFLVFEDWQRAEDYVTKHNARVADEAALEIESLRADGENDGIPYDAAEHRRTLIMDREAHIRPTILVKDWTANPTSEIC